MRPVAPQDLVVLLQVGRHGRYARAAAALGIDQTTVSRRIAALEDALGGRVLSRTVSGWELTPLGHQAVSAAETIETAIDRLQQNDTSTDTIADVVRISTPDIFAAHIAAPAAARVRQRFPGVATEIVSATRRASVQHSGLDLEVVVGRPDVVRAQTRMLGKYRLALFASREYVAAHGAPESSDDLADHGLVYFIPSMLQVDYLDVGRFPLMPDGVTSTSVSTHVAATRAGAGIGLLPTFLAAEHSDLIPLLAEHISFELEYWIVARADPYLRRSVEIMTRALFETFEAKSDAGGVLL